MVKGHKDNGMDRGGKAKGRGTQTHPQFRFIRYTPRKEDKDRVKAANVDGVAAMVKLPLECEAGYKLSLSFDQKNATFVASLSGVRSDTPNYGYILTGRGADQETAFRWLHYLHFIAFEGDWADESEVDEWDI